MFTIKHIQTDFSEDLLQVESVRFDPPTTGGVVDAGRSGKNGTPATVWADGKPLTSGTIFVMNPSGKTVARYDLTPISANLAFGGPAGLPSERTR